MHSCAWRVGNDNIRTSMLGNKVTCKDILHVTRKESEIIKAVQLCIDTRIDYSILNILDTHHLLGMGCNKVGNGTSTGIQVIDNLITAKRSELTRHLIKIIRLTTVCLIKRLRTHLETQAFHLLVYNIGSLICKHLQVAECIVALVVYNIEKRCNLRELISHIL